MVYKDVFICNESIMVEYAYKVYSYMKQFNKQLFIFTKKQKIKKILMSLIDEKDIISEYDSNTTFINSYGNYPSCNKINRKNLFKICYSYGKEGVDYRWGFKKTDVYFAASEYEKQVRYLYKNYRTIGLAKFDRNYSLPFEIEGLDPSKKNLLFLHTWQSLKSKETYTEFEKIGNILIEKFSDRFNIIHKNHHNTKYESESSIDLKNGLIDSRKLIDCADVIVAEYGGSAVEALISDKAKIIYVDTDLPVSTVCDPQDTDLLIHKKFRCTNLANLEKDLEDLIRNDVPEEEMALRRIYRDKFFPYLDCGAENLAKFIIENDEFGESCWSKEAKPKKSKGTLEDLLP